MTPLLGPQIPLKKSREMHMARFDYSETRLPAMAPGKTTPKLVSLPEKVPERTLAVRGKARVALDDQHWKRPAASETAIERS